MVMKQSITVDNKPAIRIDAVWLKEAQSGLADLYECEGDEVWVPKSVCSYNSNTDELDIQEWFYFKLEAEGKL